MAEEACQKYRRRSWPRTAAAHRVAGLEGPRPSRALPRPSLAGPGLPPGPLREPGLQPLTAIPARRRQPLPDQPVEQPHGYRIVRFIDPRHHRAS